MVYQISLEDRQIGLLEEHVIAKLKYYHKLLNDKQFVCRKPFSAETVREELRQYIGIRDENYLRLIALLSIPCRRNFQEIYISYRCRNKQ